MIDFIELNNGSLIATAHITLVKNHVKGSACGASYDLVDETFLVIRLTCGTELFFINGGKNAEIISEALHLDLR